MAQTAKRYEPPQGELRLQMPEPTWSGDVHGPVAALHQAIEDRFLSQPTMPYLPAPERPVEALVRHSSRAAGWLVLAAAFMATAHLIA